MIRIDTNAPEIEAQLRRIPQDQLPFASALALTRIAVVGMEAARVELDRDLTLRNTFSTRGIQTTRAERRDWPLQRSSVGIEERRDYLVDQALGAQRRPQRSPFKGIPQTDVVPRSPSGRMPARRRPKALLSRVGKRRSGGVGYFLVKQGSRELLFQRAKGGMVQLAYAFSRVAQIRPRFKFQEAVEAAVRANYAGELSKAIDHALATRK